MLRTTRLAIGIAGVRMLSIGMHLHGRGGRPHAGFGTAM
jgi:hypothetical protein